MNKIREDVIKTHQSLFGKPSLITCAPGRVNIIGEHVDYNGGESYTFCLGRYIYIVGNKNNDGIVKVYSHTFRRYAEIDLNSKGEKWTSFIKEAIKLWEERYGYLHLDLTIGSDLPTGAGISSSSALVCGLLSFFAESYNISLTPDEVISMASEVEYGAGLQGGLMDQTTIVKGVKEKILHLDYKNKTTTVLDIHPQYRWALVNSQIEHSLVDSEYNTRRKECQEALAAINKIKDSTHQFLSDISLEDLALLEVNSELYLRAQFVYKELQRVKQFRILAEEHHPERVGALLSESHHGLSRHYKVSTPKMDELVLAFQSCSAIYGARMMGGGFGGSIIMLTKPNSEADIQSIINTYNAQHDKSTCLITAFPVTGLRNEAL